MRLQEQERQLILDLSSRLQQSAAVIEKNNEADALIRETIANQPDVVYRLVQAVLVQQLALGQAQQDIRALQEKVQALEARAGGQPSRSNSFLGGLSEKLFGQPQQQQPQARPVQPNYSNAPYGAAPQQGAPMQNAAAPAPASSFGTNSFLGSALSTTMGVAGGMFLFQGISSLFGGHGSAFGSGAGAGSHDSIVNNYYGDSASDSSLSSFNESSVPDTSIDFDDFGGGGSDGFADF